MSEAAAAAMDVEASRDALSLDPARLQLAEVSPLALKENSVLVEQLYPQWLSLPDTARLVKSLIEDANSGSPLSLSGSAGSANAATCSSLPSMFLASSAPPLSPRSATGSPRFMKRGAGAGPSPFKSPLKFVSEPVGEVIPQFYFQHGRPLPHELKEKCLFRINELFHGHSDGLQVQGMHFLIIGSIAAS